MLLKSINGIFAKEVEKLNKKIVRCEEQYKRLQAESKQDTLKAIAKNNLDRRLQIINSIYAYRTAILHLTNTKILIARFVCKNDLFCVGSSAVMKNFADQVINELDKLKTN